MIPSTLGNPGAGRFWLAVLLTGVGTGIGAAALTRLLDVVQRFNVPGSGAGLLSAAERASAPPPYAGAARRRTGDWRGTDRPQASFPAETVSTRRLPFWVPCGADARRLRTLGERSAFCSHRGHGRVHWGREGAPKQAGAVIANFFSDRGRLSDEQRRLLVACGAGAGMGAAYGVPLGGALFALEVMRGCWPSGTCCPPFSLRDCHGRSRGLRSPTRRRTSSPLIRARLRGVVWALLAGPIAASSPSVTVRMVRLGPIAAVTAAAGGRLGLGASGCASGASPSRFPQLLGNGKEHLPVGVHEPSGAGFAADAGWR